MAILCLVVHAGCRDRARRASGGAETSRPAMATATGNPPASAPARAPPGASRAKSDRASKARCPGGMARIAGAEAWIGSPEGSGTKEEHPRFKTRLATFCLDETEVTVSAYAACVQADACEPARRGRVTCTATGGKRPDHPINCVTWIQADTYCRWKGGRLPTEAEWEYAASGGDDRSYSWGEEPPDERTCWKKPGACAVRSYEPGAFGLYDMTGNLWEWTADWYGPYPWPAVKSPTKVYRGGSWSRRFEKWMRVRLRNRWSPRKHGAHLGFRCAKTLEGTPCPFGRTEDGLGCLLGVLDAECPSRQHWNGVRCAREGEGECPAAYEKRAGFGCVLAVDVRGASDSQEDENAAVRKIRAPEFDADCEMYQPSRPVAWRFEGATHARRNEVGSGLGCKNRDVGVGWNSACCPR